MNNVITEIQKKFLDEAINSPLLFNDLANMEKYISESYSGRSLIELLQNADDAGSKRFHIELLNDSTYIVANDGREFTDEDILALCRSGSSTKTRKSNTIGFRGIGFKSVVNYANIVHLISGNIKATFSRTLTNEFIKSDTEVPLIRIPHSFYGDVFNKKINEFLNQGYKTIFIFESKNKVLEDEISEFDSSCMLFLQSIKKILLNINKPNIYEVTRNKLDETFLEVKTFKGDLADSWLITTPSIDDEKCSIGFKFDGSSIIESKNKEAVIHSFMPTRNELSMLMKVNGDFSTDPSRTRVVMDDETKHSATICATIISKLVFDVLESGVDKYGIMNILKRAKINPLSQIRGKDVNDIIIQEIQHNIKEYLLKRAENNDEVYLQPKGISNEDFINITRYLKIYGVGNRLQEKIPGLLECLKAFGIKEIPVEKCLEAMKEVECSESSRVTVLVDTINKTKFHMDKHMKENIINAQLIKFDDGIKKINEVKYGDVVEANFESSVLQLLPSSSDYSLFIKKLGLHQEQLQINKKQEKVSREHSNSSDISNVKISSFSKKKVIKKWRSVEMNVAAVLELLDDIDYVVDVSTQNLGYDLEAVLKNGKRRYYEVKSVNKLGELISITNNEYSTASQYKENYYLAIANQSDVSIDICFIKNPINSLFLSKRVTRWEWICDEYEGEVITMNIEY